MGFNSFFRVSESRCSLLICVFSLLSKSQAILLPRCVLLTAIDVEPGLELLQTKTHPSCYVAQEKLKEFHTYFSWWYKNAAEYFWRKCSTEDNPARRRLSENEQKKESSISKLCILFLALCSRAENTHSILILYLNWFSWLKSVLFFPTVYQICVKNWIKKHLLHFQPLKEQNTSKRELRDNSVASPTRTDLFQISETQEQTMWHILMSPDPCLKDTCIMLILVFFFFLFSVSTSHLLIWLQPLIQLNS